MYIVDIVYRQKYKVTVQCNLTSFQCSIRTFLGLIDVILIPYFCFDLVVVQNVLGL